ncbi:hypothetical protein AWJ20_4099 [Sugiyamaella lignohabitans]|uniref:Uncharacterized protein n=1 Tax=Sugiyamaella lignohabitans TaxID=796027 RepID=A0A167C6W7_9ASCO|nr:uncharacterized protein AWJ20_4099 [Sugiyamaella lignohabitans]ANB11295.1 hypothetical protein AWJ20_4099 [Sugiyamaella lignohabitans]
MSIDEGADILARVQRAGLLADFSTGPQQIPTDGTTPSPPWPPLFEDNGHDADSEDSDDEDDDDDSGHNQRVLDAQKEWDESMRQLGSLFTLIFFPIIGKFLGRRFSYYCKCDNIFYETGLASGGWGSAPDPVARFARCLDRGDGVFLWHRGHWHRVSMLGTDQTNIVVWRQYLDYRYAPSKPS